MPASRSARAITLAPRSCPSRHGLATSTPIGRGIKGYRLKARSFLPGAENVAYGVADFAQRGVGAYRVQDERHGVPGSFGRALQRIQRFPYTAIIAPRAQRRQFFLLALGRRLADPQHVDPLVFGLEPVDAHDDALAVFHLALVPVARARDFRLREAGLDGRDHAAQLVDAADIIVRSSEER